MKYLYLVVITILASASSFIVHISTVEWLPSWIGSQMQGIDIQPSWNFRYIAGATSIEYGFAALAIYFLGRDKLIVHGKVKASLILGIILAAIHGAFIRQPLMDVIIGNPIHVALVQNAFQWLIWFLMSFWIVFGVEFVMMKKKLSKCNKLSTIVRYDI